MDAATGSEGAAPGGAAPPRIGEYVLIVGAMKSGTTTLFDLLSRHPAIAPCAPKEPGFFAFEEHWALGFDWYDALFDFDPGRHRYGLDASTDYAKHPFCPGVPERLAASHPRRFRLIYLMRHPLRRIESHAQHVQLNRCEVGRCVSPRRDHCLSQGVSPVSLAASRYAGQLDRYRDLFDQGRVLPLLFEDLTADQAGTLARIWAFLGLETPALDAPAHANSSAGRRRVPAYWQRLDRLGPLSRAAKALVPQRLRHRLRDSLRTVPEIQGRFTLTAAEEAGLREVLAEDLARLRSRYGIDTERAWGM